MVRMQGLAVGFVVIALLAGCSPSPAPTPSTTSITTPPATSTPSASASVDPDAPAGQCADDSIEVAVTESDAGAGNLFYQVNFTNSGTEPCELRGFPGVSVVGDGDETQIGASATELQDGPAVETYTIAPGDTIGALLTAVNIESGGGPLGDECEVRSGDGWRVFPPHSFEAVFVEAPGVAACGNKESPWLTIAPISAE